MAILDASDYPSVRRSIDVTLDDGVIDDADRILPNTVIADEVFSNQVDLEIATVLPVSGPTWPGSLTAPQEAMVKQAAILLTAALIYPRIPVITQEQMGEHRYRREYESVADVVARLRDEAYEAMAPVLELYVVAATAPRTDRFRRATASRGR